MNCFYFKLSLTKHYLNMFKRWCERGISLPRVLIKMKRKTDSVEEEHGSKNEGNESSGDESEDAEPRIKDVFE